MKYDVEANKIILEQKPCYCTFPYNAAGPGKQYKEKYCMNRTKTRGVHNCELKRCPNNPSGKSQWHSISRTEEVCYMCKGSLIVNESICDYIGQENADLILKNIPIIVFLSNRPASWNESNLGMDCLYSVIDYGDYKKQADPQKHLAENVKERFKSTQAIKIAKRDTHQVCDAIAIYCNQSGYSIRAFWKEEGEKKFLGASAQTGLMEGMAAYRAGTNGTLVAASIE